MNAQTKPNYEVYLRRLLEGMECKDVDLFLKTATPDKIYKFGSFYADAARQSIKRALKERLDGSSGM
jgi:hypothetical protein